MPTCGNCISPCSCALSEDGFFGGDASKGRNFTQVEGDGSVDNPFVIHFLDQKEFRPKAAEIAVFDALLINAALTEARLVAGPFPSGNVTYETPISFLVRADASGIPFLAEANYFVLGASVTFAEAADATTAVRQIALTTRREPAAGVQWIIGSQITPGGSSDPLTLSCMGFTPGLFTLDPSLTNIIQGFNLYIYQNSGAPLRLFDVRIWMAQI